MAEYQFTVDDLDALVEALEPLSEQLTDREQALLLAALTIAGRQLMPDGDDVAEVEGHGLVGGAPAIRIQGGTVSLTQGFRGAFSAGKVGRLKGWQFEPVEDEIIAARRIRGN